MQAINNSEVHILAHENAETVDENEDAFNQLKDEAMRRKIELEAEERKLEETLEYQRRIENEAKQKHLAEQLKNNHADNELRSSRQVSIEVGACYCCLFLMLDATMSCDNCM